MSLSRTDQARAEASFREAQRLLERIRDPAAKARSLRALARAMLDAGRKQDARRHFAEAISAARSGGVADLVAKLDSERKAFA